MQTFTAGHLVAEIYHVVHPQADGAMETFLGLIYGKKLAINNYNYDQRD